MEQKTLGNSNLQVYPVAFGGNVFGWTADEKRSFELLDAFVGEGFNFIDTADVYSRWADKNKGGESEAIIGKWLAKSKNREKMVIATKVGWDMGDGKKGLRKKYILEAADASLKRLKTDYIDLYQTHKDDQTTPVEETLEAYDQLIRDGKIRYIGASNISVERLKESLAASREHGLPEYQSVQPHYNLFARQEFEEGLEPVCLGNNLGVITYYSLESGFLTGKYRNESDLSKSPRGQNLKRCFTDRGFKILAALDKISGQTGENPATVALAWLINRPSVTAPIVSATSLDQLKSITAAPKLELTSDMIRFLNSESTY